LKIILLDYQSNYVGRSKSKQCCRR